MTANATRPSDTGAWSARSVAIGGLAGQNRLDSEIELNSDRRDVSSTSTVP
jgi:hypothetical protein